MVTNGTGRPPWSICRGRRIIPACAEGTTLQATCAHQVGGSSPHTRGTPGCVTRDARRNRDHSRMRGEHSLVDSTASSEPGIIPSYAGSTLHSTTPPASKLESSPHTRGAPAARHRPARASRDHPRIRGEHAQFTASAKHTMGIIPACAGSTTVSPESVFPCGDHPRIRGEHHSRRHREGLLHGIIPAYAVSTGTLEVTFLCQPGSSPHTRGAPRCNRPTCSGGTDHPRIRG